MGASLIVKKVEAGWYYEILDCEFGPYRTIHEMLFFAGRVIEQLLEPSHE